MCSFSKHALAVLALFSLFSSVHAALIQGPTGVEYVKRFQPSAGPGCFYQCPAQIGSFVVLDPQGTEVQNGIRTRCDYVMLVLCFAILDSRGALTGRPFGYPSSPGQTTVQLVCRYDSITGAKTGGGAQCPNVATQVCEAKKRRKLSKLEQTIKDRQYTPPKARRADEQ
jgi:hypothetical protein